MSYRPSLYFKSKQPSDHHFEFEAQNLLPLFWLTLLDKSIVYQLKPKLSFVEHLFPDETRYEQFMSNEKSAPYFELEINAQSFKQNSQNGEQYIAEVYPEKLALYQDFIRFIAIDGEDESIAINTYDLFDNSAQAVIDYLLGELKNIHDRRRQAPSDTINTEETPYFLIGYSDEFASYSQSYYLWLNELEQHSRERARLQRHGLRNMRHSLFQLMSVLAIALAALSFVAFYLFVINQEIYNFATLLLMPLGLLLLYIAYRVTD